MKKKRIFTSICFAAVLFAGIFFIMKKIGEEFRSLDNDLADTLPSTFKLLDNHIGLISERFRNEISVNEVFHDKFRDPISLMYYGNEYNLIVYQINYSNNLPLNNFIIVNEKEASTSVGVSYGVITRDLFFKFKYRSGKIGEISKMFVELSGDSLTMVQNSDSILSYHILCKKLAVRYSTDEPIDIFITGNDLPLGKSAIIPMDILFLQKHNHIYMLIMTPRKYKASIEPEKLLNIVIGKS